MAYEKPDKNRLQTGFPAADVDVIRQGLHGPDYRTEFNGLGASSEDKEHLYGHSLAAVRLTTNSFAAIV
jgi:hypothetical protein